MRRDRITLGLMAIVWWSAHCLTRDCTHLDEDAEIGNEGVLDAAGIRAAPAKKEEEVAGERDDGTITPVVGWFERYQSYREKQRKKRTPGVWVVYFSLAALPIFGLGQALIDEVGHDDHRGAQQVGAGCRGQPHRSRAGHVDRGARFDPGGHRTVKPGWEDVGEHGQVTNLLQGLIPIGEPR